jgi:hypothetical protein
LDHNIKLYDNVISASLCSSLIESYSKEEAIVRDTKGYSFSEINIRESLSFKLYRSEVYHAMEAVHKQYSSEHPFFPISVNYESPRIKRYEQETGYFDWHIDAANSQTCNRILVMFFYLNDVESGGETLFDLGCHQSSVKPKAGSVLCFPPTWEYPHKGCTPLSSPKYVISSYVQM